MRIHTVAASVGKISPHRDCIDFIRGLAVPGAGGEKIGHAAFELFCVREFCNVQPCAIWYNGGRRRRRIL